jgi:hypothetical protein
MYGIYIPYEKSLISGSPGHARSGNVRALTEPECCDKSVPGDRTQASPTPAF